MSKDDCTTMPVSQGQAHDGYSVRTGFLLSALKLVKV